MSLLWWMTLPRTDLQLMFKDIIEMPIDYYEVSEISPAVFA